MRSALVLAALAGVLVLPASAPAVFPGDNGKILILVGCCSQSEIRALDPVTGASTTLATNAQTVAASPDGTKITFSRGGNVWVMNADGTGQTQVNIGWVQNSTPSWAPDGTKITFVSNLDETGSKVYVMDADGQNSHRITTSDVVRNDLGPLWSPDGTWIAFTKGFEWLWKIRPDGSDQAQVRINSGLGSWSPDSQQMLIGQQNGNIYITDANGNNAVNRGPGFGDATFSPDGRKIAYGAFAPGGSCCAVWTMNSDGTGRAQLAVTQQYFDMDWPPAPINYYPRPKGATPVRASLVPAYQECTSANRVHGPPLENPSCNPPAQSSAHVTVGTPDANFEAANSVGSVSYQVVTGIPATPADEADVGIVVHVTDVRVKSDLSDYTGELRALAGLGLTDKDNTPAFARAATVEDSVLGATVPCTPTPADATTGSECSIGTSADALFPDTVKEGMRSVWQLGAVRVDDGGGDGDADTAADNTRFLTQGIFVP